MTIEVRLPFRAPLLPDSLFGHLAATAVPGVEEWRDGSYRRSVRLPHGPAIVALAPPHPVADPRSGPGTASHAGPGPRAGPDSPHRPGIVCRLTLSDPRDLDAAVARCRFLLDLDADPAAIDTALAADPVLRPWVAAAPGRRMPRCVDPHELALRTVLGQQVSTAAARTHAARLVAAHGEPVDDPGGGLTHLFPTAGRLAGIDPDSLALPHERRRTFVRLAGALADGRVTLADTGTARVQLAALPGIGPWTIDTITMRALGDPDAFLPGDLGVRAAARRLGLPATPGALVRRAQAWRPYRAYAVLHLWGTTPHPVNTLPP